MSLARYVFFSAVDISNDAAHDGFEKLASLIIVHTGDNKVTEAMT